MRPPEFWTNPPDAPGLAARLLSPLGWVYASLGRLRRAFARPYAPGAPVICIGNPTVGGAGKTPTALAVCDRLAALGATPHLLSRGYGGRKRGPHRVDPKKDRAIDVGDEPLLMARRRPVWIGSDRRKTARAAISAGADVLVMDDGHQNPYLRKDLSILVVDAAIGYGNERVIPAGPLREPVEDSFARADAAILIGQRPADRPWPWTRPDRPTLHARLTPDTGGRSLRGEKVLAFAGIGRPEKFFETLRELGAELIDAVSFPDHYAYNAAMLQRLEARAASSGAILATTEKDAARFPQWFQGRALVVTVELGFADPSAIDALLRPVLEAPRRGAPQQGERTEPRFSALSGRG